VSDDELERPEAAAPPLSEPVDEPVAEPAPDFDAAPEVVESEPTVEAAAEAPAIATPAEASTPALEPSPAEAPSEPPAPPAPPPPINLAPVPPSKARPGLIKRIAVIALALILFGPPLQVAILRIVPPLFTELMVQRLIQGYGWDYQWRPISQMSPDLTEAAVASEDARFCSHHGFDFQAMEKAMRHNERRPNGKVKGGSTISQQTAKNVFLWPGRSYVRKGIEAWYTVLIETLWGKRRIMEVYLNVVEFGPGVYGAQAASQHYFHEDASQLSPAQAAHLISVLPDPLKWRVAAPGAYVAKRSRRIDGAIGTVRDDGLAGCVGR